MDDFFTPISTTYTKSKETTSLGGPRSPGTAPAAVTRSKRAGVSSPEDALETLKAQPDYDALISVLNYLSKPELSGTSKASFSIHTSSPLSAQITQVLVTEIAPNYWPLLREGSLDGSQSAGRTTDLDIFLECLRSLAGLNTILLRLRALVQEIKAGKGGPKRPDLVLNINLVLELLCALLDGSSTVQSVWSRATARSGGTSKNHHVSHELVSSLARGKVVALAAEADALSREGPSSAHWVSDGQKYSKWLALSIASWVKDDASDEGLKVCGELLVRSLSLGYPGSCSAFSSERSLLCILTEHRGDKRPPIRNSPTTRGWRPRGLQSSFRPSPPNRKDEAILIFASLSDVNLFQQAQYFRVFVAGPNHLCRCEPHLQSDP